VGAPGFFSIADWIVIFVYLGAMIAMGVSFGKDQRNTRDYFLGNKSISWWGIGLSIVATETSALTIIGVPAIAYGGNMLFLQIIIGYVIARVILAVVMVPHYFKGEIYSPYQLLEHSFGPGARRTASVFFLFTETLSAGVRVYVACIPIKLMLGVDILPAIILFIGLSLIYTYIGGFKAVIWTDAVQFFLFVGGGVYTLLYIPTLIDGGWSTIFTEAAAAGKTQWINTNFSLQPPVNLWMGIIGATVMVMATHGAEQLIVQRLIACRSVAEGRKALVLSAVIIFPMFLLFLLVGVMLWVYYQKTPLPIPLPESGRGLKQNDFIYPIFMITAVPHVLKGFLIVAILAAAMSSVSSALTALASVSTMDIMKNLLKGKRDDDYFLRFSKTSTVFWAAALVLVAIVFVTRVGESALNAALGLRGLTSGALLAGMLLTIFWRKASGIPVVLGMVVSLVAMIAIFSSGKVYWPWYTLIGTTIALLVASIARGFIRDEKV
jgi:SSS family transporter